MELVEGDTLAERIARGPLELGELLPIAIQITDGLAAAHAKTIVHRDLEDVFAVQDEIAASIADALRVVLSPKERQAIQKVPTANLEAYDLYLRGRAELRKLTEESIVQAQHLFRRATELDPDFTPAWLEHDPDMDPIRNHPRFRALLDRMGAPSAS
jgi:hypothetical protein